MKNMPKGGARFGYVFRIFSYFHYISLNEKTAKRIGYTVTTTVTYALRKTNQERDVRYWTYHEDKDNYAIVFVSSKVLEKLDFSW